MRMPSAFGHVIYILARSGLSRRFTIGQIFNVLLYQVRTCIVSKGGLLETTRQRLPHFYTILEGFGIEV
jgi:hypothetical protein